MFSKILVAYDGSLESGRALLTAIHLAKSLNAELGSIGAGKSAFLCGLHRCRRPFGHGFLRLDRLPGGTLLLRQQAADYYRDCRRVRNRPLSAKA